ncbi:MAG: hypothetical protein LW832_05955 [Parachlamydia sp.]|nr:hypothetical protein [Parachlamydia sp.]
MCSFIFSFKTSIQAMSASSSIFFAWSSQEDDFLQLLWSSQEDDFLQQLQLHLHALFVQHEFVPQLDEPQQEFPFPSCVLQDESWQFDIYFPFFGIQLNSF